MKRFHVHVAVADLDQSIGFYSTLFGSEPTVRKSDYAKWMLEDPRINFAVSRRTEKFGVNHLGLQVDSDDELKSMRDRLEKADGAMLEEVGAQCCYAKSDKYWITDPQGVAWETFHSLGAIPVYGEEEAKESTCCAPEPSERTASATACCSGSC
jgi:catechol 2,3-dioxygenase-like lactoylglutathione lyase family enzyme